MADRAHTIVSVVILITTIVHCGKHGCHRRGVVIIFLIIALHPSILILFPAVRQSVNVLVPPAVISEEGLSPFPAPMVEFGMVKVPISEETWRPWWVSMIGDKVIDRRPEGPSRISPGFVAPHIPVPTVVVPMIGDKLIDYTRRFPCTIETGPRKIVQKDTTPRWIVRLSGTMSHGPYRAPVPMSFRCIWVLGSTCRAGTFSQGSIQHHKCHRKH